MGVESVPVNSVDCLQLAFCGDDCDCLRRQHQRLNQLDIEPIDSKIAYDSLQSFKSNFSIKFALNS
jgi:hypothetical protein